MSVSYIKVITVDGKYLSSVFTGINAPISQWKVNTTTDHTIAIPFRQYERDFFNMLEGVFPQHKFGIKKVKKYKPCACIKVNQDS